MTWRIGQFLIFVGLIILIVFFASDQLRRPNYFYFFSGVILVVGGGYVMWLGREPKSPSDRFRLLRKPKKKSESKEEKL